MAAEERKLIDKIKAGNAGLYEKLVAKYEKPLFNFVLQMVGNYHTAQDITQEAFIKAYHGINSFQPQARFSTWLYKIARNLCIDFFRQRKSPEVITELAAVSTCSPEEEFITLEFHRELGKAVMALKEEYKTVFCLRIYQNLSYGEIAEVVECPVGTVRSRLARAREMVRTQMKTYFKDALEEVPDYAL